MKADYPYTLFQSQGWKCLCVCPCVSVCVCAFLSPSNTFFFSSPTFLLFVFPLGCPHTQTTTSPRSLVLLSQTISSFPRRGGLALEAPPEEHRGWEALQGWSREGIQVLGSCWVSLGQTRSLGTGIDRHITKSIFLLCDSKGCSQVNPVIYHLQNNKKE